MRNSLSCCRTIILNEVKAIAVQLLRHLTCHLFSPGKMLSDTSHPAAHKDFQNAPSASRGHVPLSQVQDPGSRGSCRLHFNVLDGISPFAILQKNTIIFFSCENPFFLNTGGIMLNKNPRRKPLNSPPTCAALFTYALPNPAYRDRTTANTALFRKFPQPLAF